MKYACVVKRFYNYLLQVRRVSPNDYPKPIERISEDPRYKTIRLLQEKVNSLTPAGLSPEIVAVNALWMN